MGNGTHDKQRRSIGGAVMIMETLATLAEIGIVLSVIYLLWKTRKL